MNTVNTNINILLNREEVHLIYVRLPYLVPVSLTLAVVRLLDI